MTEVDRSLEFAYNCIIFLIKYKYAGKNKVRSDAGPELSSGEKQIKFFIDRHLIKYIKAAKLA